MFLKPSQLTLVATLAVGMTQVPQAQALLVGVTHRDLVLIDELNPSAVVSLGAHGLSGLSARSLAYDPGTGTLYGLASNRTTGIQKLVSYDLGTGAATIIADLGSLPSVGYFETLAFDSDANRLVASKASNPATWVSDELVELGLDGSTSLIMNTRRDNDFGAFGQGTLYTVDIYGANVFVPIDLGGAVGDPLAPAPNLTTGVLAYSLDHAALFASDTASNRLYSLSLNGLVLTDLGVIAGNSVLGLAFLPEPASKVVDPQGVNPEPATASLAALGAAGLLLSRRRRSN
jgi:MYXO-CTERM domain-containing protein